MAFPDGLNPDQEMKLLDELTRLRGILRETCRENNAYDMIREQAFALSVSSFTPPDWLSIPTATPHGIPTLFLSDWHWGEVVSPSEISQQNEYSLPIAQKRAQACFEEFIRVYTKELKRPWDGLVLALGGDMVSGDIHDELAQTNDLPSLPTVLDCAEHLASGIRLLLNHFPRIHVFGVVGNHGRTTQKPRYKKRVTMNHDWMIYALLERYFKEDQRVKFFIPESSDCYYHIYETRYLLTHGDQLGGRSTDPIIGAMNTVSRGDQARRNRQTAEGKPYDVLICGHWHQLGMLPKRIINGNLKGPDEYSYGHAFAPEPPRQASWVTEPGRGIVSTYIIHCE